MNDRVDMIDVTTDEVVDFCRGPSLGGLCPHPESDGTVPCAGRRVASEGMGPEHWMVWVPERTAHCPLGWNLDI